MTDAHIATIRWRRDGGDFTRGRYSRAHSWHFDGGVVVAASSSPHVVPLPWSDAAAVDPEEAFVAALASCHMLWFLSIAAERGFVVEEYADPAQGTMARNGNGKLMVAEVLLRPTATFSGERHPTANDIAAMHHAAHAECFLANSVITRITCIPG